MALKSLYYYHLLLISSCVIGPLLARNPLIGNWKNLPNPGDNGFYDQPSGRTYHWKFSNESNSNFPKICDDAKAVLCIVKDEDVIVKNAGDIKNVTEIKDSSDHISLTFDNGQDCLSSHSKKYRTRFDFFCSDHGREYPENKFMLAQTGDPCEINFFIWFDFPGCLDVKDNSSKSTSDNNDLINCQIHDGSNVYDLTSLQASNEDWIAYDTRPGKTQRKYHLSVCKPLPNSHTCPDPKTSVCLTQVNDGTSHNSFTMGTTMKKLEVKKEEDAVAIILTNNGYKDYSTQIIFRCDEIEHGPKYYDSFDDSYIFEWRTPAACPQVDSNSTTKCIIRDDFFGHTFDLTRLHNKERDYNSIKDININICGGLNKSGCKKGSTICKTQGISLGYSNSETLTFQDGHLTLSYQGDTCPSETSRKYISNILLQCHHDVGTGNPELMFHENCTYNFIWKSSLACPPFDKVDCTVKDENGELFDFSPLALSDTNYEIPMGQSYIILNVCKSLVHSPSIKCSYKSAVCHSFDQNGEKHFENLGEVISGPFLDDHNRLVLSYSNGGMCKESNTNETHMTTKIIFNCRMDRKDSKPTFVDQVGCTYTFWWDHHLACSSNSSDLITKDSCMVKDDQSGHVYDFRPLKKLQKSLTTQDKDGNKYSLRICSALSKDLNKDLGSSSAACMVNAKGTETKNIGNVTDRLTLQNHKPVIHYDNGIYHTSVHFKCAPIRSVQDGQLVLLEQIKNHYYFDYFTTLACPYTVPCEVATYSGLLQSNTDMLLYDLSSLKNYDEDIQVQKGSVNTYFSVCKPLVSQTSYGCPYGTAICSLIHDSSGKVKEIRGYGNAVQAPRIEQKLQLEVVLNYEGGSICKGDIRFSSTIKFICNPSVFPGQPILDHPPKDQECHANYKWETMAACPNTSSPLIEDTPSRCRIFHPFKHSHYSLNYLRHSYQEDYTVKSNENPQNIYHIQPCGTSKFCQNEDICTSAGGGGKNNNVIQKLGSLTSSQFFMSSKELRLTYQSDQDCPHGDKFSSEIRVICNDEEVDDKNAKKESKIELVDELPCHPIFKMSTSQICSAFVYDDDDSKSKKGTTSAGAWSSHSTSSSSSRSSFWTVSIVFVVSLLVGAIVLKKPQYREKARDGLIWLKVKLFHRRRREDRTNLLVSSNVIIPAFGTLEVDDDEDLIIA